MVQADLTLSVRFRVSKEGKLTIPDVSQGLLFVERPGVPQGYAAVGLCGISELQGRQVEKVTSSLKVSDSTRDIRTGSPEK